VCHPPVLTRSQPQAETSVVSQNSNRQTLGWTLGLTNASRTIRNRGPEHDRRRRSCPNQKHPQMFVFDGLQLIISHCQPCLAALGSSAADRTLPMSRFVVFGSADGRFRNEALMPPKSHRSALRRHPASLEKVSLSVEGAGIVQRWVWDDVVRFSPIRVWFQFGF
jgi:hypothetical protein